MHDIGRLRADLEGGDPAARHRAMDDLLALPWEISRDALLDALARGPWPDRARLLKGLDARFGLIHAERVLEALAEDERFDPDAPVLDASPEARERAARCHVELAHVFLRFSDRLRARGAAERALEIAPRELSRARAGAEHVLAVAALRDHDLAAAAELAGLACAAMQRLRDAAGEAEATDTLGFVHLERGELGEAEHCFRRALQLAVEAGDAFAQASVEGNLGRLALVRGETEQALEWLHRSRRGSRDLGDDHGDSVRCNQIAEAHVQAGDLPAAREAAAEGLAAAGRSHDPRDVAHCERMLGWIALEEHRLDDATPLLDRARGLFAALSEIRSVAKTDQLRGRALRMRGRLAEAASALDAAIAAFRELGDRAGESGAWLEMSLLRQVEGDAAAQGEALATGLRLANQLPRTMVREELYRAHAQLHAGGWLQAAGVASARDVADLIDAATSAGRGLGRMLLERGAVTPQGLSRLLREKAGIATATVASLAGPGVRSAASCIPRRLAERLSALPLERKGRALRVAMSDPLDFRARFELGLATGCEIEPVLVPAEDLDAALRRAYSRPRLGLERFDDVPEAMKRLLDHAAESGASDLHLEPRRDALVIRMRVDGVLHECDRMPSEAGRKLVSRLKALSGMDIAERRLAQDGRLRHVTKDDAFSLRLATLPVLHGEKLVIRFLGAMRAMTLHEIGVDESIASSLSRFISRQEGMLLAVGPTGSGKSTTLQALLTEVDASERSVVTVEDPVEFEVDAFAQSQVNADAGHGYAEALRALLRQDPNVILLGEIRDGESATIACRMALTGHLVLSTLHTYDAIAAVARLSQMGVPPYVVAAVVKCVIAQRLVRRLCASCSKPEPVDRQWLRAFDREKQVTDVLVDADVRGPDGCERCGFRGYKGRLPIFELLEMNATLAQQVREGRTDDDLRRSAILEGFRPMRLSALARVAAGDTSQAEVSRVL